MCDKESIYLFLPGDSKEFLYDENKTIVILYEKSITASDYASVIERGGGGVSFLKKNNYREKLVSYIDDFENRITKSVCPILNTINNVKHSFDYWSTMFQASSLPLMYYDCYERIIELKQMHPTVRLFSKEVYEYELAERSCIQTAMEGWYCRNIAIQILQYYRMIDEVSLLSKEYEENAITKSKLSFWQKKRRKQYDFITSLYIQKATSEFSSFRLRDILSVRYLYDLSDIKVRKKRIDVSRRHVLKRVEFAPKSDFEAIFCLNLHKNISVLFVEQYSEICQGTDKYKTDRINQFTFKGYSAGVLEFAAYIAEKKGKIRVQPHCLEQEMELIPDDLLYSKCELETFYRNCTVKNVVHLMTLGLPRVNRVTNADNLIYVQVAFDEYVYPITFSEYIYDKQYNRNASITKFPVFYSNLCTEISEKMIFRAREQYGHKYVDYILDKTGISNNQIDSSFISENPIYFEQVLEKSKLLVVDCFFSSTWIKALFYNIPFIIVDYIDYSEIVTEDAMFFYNKMKEVGILFGDAKVAAEFINDNYGVIESIWNTDRIQDVLNLFRNNIDYVIK